MKILLIHPFFPYEKIPHGGKRVFHFLNFLAKNHEVSLACIDQFNEAKDHLKELKRICKHVVVVPNPRIPKLKLLAKFLFSRKPFSVLRFESEALRSKIEELTESENFNVVQIGFGFMADYVKAIKGANTAKILDDDELVFKALERNIPFEKNLPLLTRIKNRIEARKMKSFELEIMDHFDHVITITKNEHDFIRKIKPGLPVSVVGIGHNPETFLNQDIEKESDTVVFIGSFSHKPNSDAVLFFAKKILPIIWRANPKVKFYVVGKDPTQEIKALQSDRIIVTGFVDDPNIYLQKSLVAILPIRMGGGFRIKLIEYMASGTPVVGTRIGFEGLNPKAINDNMVFVAENPEDFAQKVLSLINKLSLRQEVSRKAKEFVTANYSWDKIGSDLEKVLLLASEEKI